MTAYLDLVNFSTMDPTVQAQSFEVASAARQALIEDLLVKAPRTFAGFCWPLVVANEACDRLFTSISVLNSTCADDKVRAAYDKVRRADTQFSSWAMNSRALEQAYRDVLASDQSLDAWQGRWLTLHIRDYKKRGSGLDDAARLRLSEIAQQLQTHSTQFARNLQDTIDEWVIELSQEQVSELPGLLVEYLAGVAKAKLPHCEFAADLSLVSVMGVLTNSNDRALRERVWRANETKGTHAGPGGEARDNVPLITQILSLRHEHATICGYPDYATYATYDRMCKTPQAAQFLLLSLRGRARPKAQEEWAQLCDYAASQGLPTPLCPWDSDRVAQMRRESLFGFSADEVAEYLPYEQVFAGMLSLSTDLFGVNFKRDDSVSTWHPSVSFYRVFDATGSLLGGFYSDPFARHGKKSGAWVGTVQSRLKDSLQVAYMCCNSAPPTEDRPALLQHKEAVTLFHEFGHCLHHMLAQSPLPGVNSSGVERDAIECPSQMMENFIWDKEVLARLACHFKTAQPLPPALLDRMLTARFDGAGLALVRQLVFGLVDLAVHSGQPVQDEEALWALGNECRNATHVIPLSEGDHMLAAFAHIFSGGYAAGYYGYLWAEVLSADAFAAFNDVAGSVIDAATGLRFREEILAVGALRDFSESFEAFRDRPPQEMPLLLARNLVS